MTTRWSRRAVLRGSASAAGFIALSGCTSDQPAAPVLNSTSAPAGATAATTPATPAPSAGGRGPAPRSSGDVRVLAQAGEDGIRLHTTSGDLTFWGGVRLTGTLPGSPAGSMGGTAAHYRRWFAAMGEFGVPFVRLDRLHPAACYAELARYNAGHPQAPLYLIQGISLPSALTTPDLFSGQPSAGMRAVISEAVAAMHGRMGQYRASVLRWLAAWIIDLGWDPARIASSDQANEPMARYRGRYVSSAEGSSPTETWLARMLDELAGELTARGVSVPLAFVNRPETDPIPHPEPRIPPQNISTLNPAHLSASSRWPGGLFSFYDAPPYRPEFIEGDKEYGSDADPYLAYLLALKGVTGTLPLMIGGFGVTSALGSGYPGTAGRSQGDHNEPRMFEINAHVLQLLAEHGFAGGMLGHWADDWSAGTWNTTARAALIPQSRRTLVHDPLTADQWGGIMAFTPRASTPVVVHEAPANGLQRVLLSHDPEWLYLTLEFNGRVTSPVEVGFDIIGSAGIRLPGGSGKPIHDVALRTVPTMSTTYLFVRAGLDPLQIDGVPLPAIPSDAERGWHRQRLLQSPPPAEESAPGLSRLSFQLVGDLKLGNWDTGSDDYDSRATWHLKRESGSAPARLRYRLPWGLINVLDPSQRGAVRFRGNEPRIVTARAMTITIESSTVGSPVDFLVPLPRWSALRYRERLKEGAEVLSQAFARTTGLAD